MLAFHQSNDFYFLQCILLCLLVQSLVSEQDVLYVKAHTFSVWPYKTCLWFCAIVANDQTVHSVVGESVKKRGAGGQNKSDFGSNYYTSIVFHFQGGFQVFYWPWPLLQEKHYMWDGRHSALTFSIKTPQSPLQTRDSFKRLTRGPQQAPTVAALMCFGSPVGLPSSPGSFQDEGHTLNYTSICRARVRMCVGWGEVGGERRGGRRGRRKKKKGLK